MLSRARIHIAGSPQVRLAAARRIGVMAGFKLLMCETKGVGSTSLSIRPGFLQRLTIFFKGRRAHRGTRKDMGFLRPAHEPDRRARNLLFYCLLNTARTKCLDSSSINPNTARYWRVSPPLQGRPGQSDGLWDGERPIFTHPGGVQNPGRCVNDLCISKTSLY